MTTQPTQIPTQLARRATAKVYAVVVIPKREASADETALTQPPNAAPKPRARLADVYRNVTATQTAPVTTTNGDSE